MLRKYNPTNKPIVTEVPFKTILHIHNYSTIINLLTFENSTYVPLEKNNTEPLVINECKGTLDVLNEIENIDLLDVISVHSNSSDLNNEKYNSEKYNI